DLGAPVREPPVAMVIGAVAALDLRWFEDRPLLGRRVVVCRAPAQASGLVQRLRRHGAEAIGVPVIEMGDAADGGEALRTAVAGAYDWVAFTSVNAVDRFFACVRDARALGGVQVAAVGPGTAAALETRGVVADALPAPSVAWSLVEALGEGAGRRVLLPQAAA